MVTSRLWRQGLDQLLSSVASRDTSLPEVARLASGKSVYCADLSEVLIIV